MWSSKKQSPYTNQRPVLLPTPPPTHQKKPPHRPAPAPARHPTFFGAAAARQNDAVAHQFATARVGAVFAHARSAHLPTSQLVGPLRHPGVPRSPYVSDRVVEGSSASDSRCDPLVAPRPFVRTALVPPHYALPDAGAAEAVGASEGRVRGLLVRDRVRDEERRRRKIRRLREVVEEEARKVREVRERKEAEERRIGEQRRKMEEEMREKEREERECHNNTINSRRRRRRRLHSSSKSKSNRLAKSPFPLPSPTQPKPRRSCLKNPHHGAPKSKGKTKAKTVRFFPDTSLGMDTATGDPVPYRATDRRQYEARHHSLLQQNSNNYLHHRAMRKQRAAALMQERYQRVQRNGGIERDVEMQQRLMRRSISGGEDRGGEVVMLGMTGVDGEGAR
ncbi:uncharacterized protein PG986_010670 [Apiospora aurea]|uniref:Uncharacterized protein n=1 Tax=Apiospora aurea TaxID=335848 RepID=A0ABR1Q2X8_9PEZI